MKQSQPARTKVPPVYRPSNAAARKIQPCTERVAPHARPRTPAPPQVAPAFKPSMAPNARGATSPVQARHAVVVPPAYRPQRAITGLQPRLVDVAQKRGILKAPPAYRPGTTKGLQRKAAKVVVPAAYCPVGNAGLLARHQTSRCQIRPQVTVQRKAGSVIQMKWEQIAFPVSPIDVVGLEDFLSRVEAQITDIETRNDAVEISFIERNKIHAWLDSAKSRLHDLQSGNHGAVSFTKDDIVGEVDALARSFKRVLIPLSNIRGTLNQALTDFTSYQQRQQSQQASQLAFETELSTELSKYKNTDRTKISNTEPQIVSKPKARVFEHLSQFHAITESLTGSENPSNVFEDFRVNGARFRDELPDPEGEAQIKTPNSTEEVTKTQSDGEVAILVSVLKRITAFMRKKEKNIKTTATQFTLALSGPSGACDGCKARIAKLIELFEERAQKFFAQDVSVSLVVTYKYFNKPYKGGNGGLYGWKEDEKQGSPYHHTAGTSVLGTSEI